MQGPTDVIVVGAGVVGLTTARALLAAGLRVLLLERAATPARQASWAGGGIVCPLRPWAEPPAVWSWVDRSRALYPSLADTLRDETGIDIEYRLSGIEWHLPLAERLTAAAAWLQTAGLVFERHAEALCCDSLGQVRNPRLGRALAAAVRRAGGEIRHAEVARLQRSGDRITGVVLADGGVLAAAAVVVASGPWAGSLLGTIGVPSSVAPIRGQMLLKRVPGAAGRRIGIGESVYVIPRADDHVLIGSTIESVGFDSRVTPEALIHLQRAADAQFPWQAASPVLAQWAGLRPGSADGMPTVGAGGPDGLWLNVGHYRNGIALAPACAEHLTAAICTQPQAARRYQSSLLPL